MALNSAKLIESGFEYPSLDDVSAASHGVVTGGGNAATLAKAFLSVGHPFALKDVSQKGLIKEHFSLILEASKRNLIFSSELFSMLTKESVNDLKSFISDFDYEIFLLFICGGMIK